MPGHKLGKGIPAGFLKALYSLDVTEIPGTDNLHFPQGAIKEAQELAAGAFGARHTFFLVNGSTCGIHAMIMTVCRPGDRLIVARDCHKAVIGGMMLAGVEPIYVKPQYNKKFGIAASVSPEDIEAALTANPDAAGVFITRPNYYGVCSDIEELVRVTHSHGKILMVDEAHGSHLRFSEKLPACALDAGADICVQSAHKTLPAFTQSAYLHVGSVKIDVDKLCFNLGMLQTSSPSYILMAFLDIARAVMEKDGRERLEELLGNIGAFEQQVESLSRLALLKDTDLDGGSLDRTRIVIRTSDAGLSGFEEERILREHYGIQVEMSDLNNIVCISTISDTRQDLDQLGASLKEISKNFKDKPPAADIHIKDIKLPEQGVGLKEILHLKGMDIPLKEAAGKVSLKMLTPYPPGIPLICPGEIITGEMVDYIHMLINAGGNITGLSEEQKIKIVE